MVHRLLASFMGVKPPAGKGQKKQYGDLNDLKKLFPSGQIAKN